jgi:hypothetical protein
MAEAVIPCGDAAARMAANNLVMTNLQSLSDGFYQAGNKYRNQLVLQQYMVDMQRLMLFNNAELKTEDVKDLQVTFSRVNGKTFTVAAAHLENLPPENIS